MEQREHLPRKLAAIVYADVAGYSRLTGEDEDTTHRRLSEYLDLIAAEVERHGGQVMHYAGDAVLAMFEAVVDALLCGANIQRSLETHNADLPDERKVQFRIGVNLGDVIEDRGDIYGDGVNVAARLESLAEPGGICISEAVRGAAGSKLPLTYEDLGEQEVKNIAEPIRVYRALTAPDAQLPPPAASPKKRASSFYLAAAVAILMAVGGGLQVWLQPWAPREQRIAFSPPDKPSIAVLPFDNLSADSEQDYFVDGMTDDLITDLSKLSELFVISRNSTFTYKGKSVKVEQVAQELGVRYILEGSVRRAADQVRINAQLIDGETGGHIWAERYDGSLADVFALQDRITKHIVDALAVTLTPQEAKRVAHFRTDNVAAHDAYLLGLSFYYRGTPEDNGKAAAHFEKAIELDTAYSPAYTALAKVYGRSVLREAYYSVALGISRRESNTKMWQLLGSSAVEPDADFHILHSWLALQKRNHGRAIGEANLALEISPNNVDALEALSEAQIYAGHIDEGLANAQKAILQSPAAIARPLYLKGLAEYIRGNMTQAIAFLQTAVELAPESTDFSGLLAAVYAELGDIERARAAFLVFGVRDPIEHRAHPPSVSTTLSWFPFSSRVAVEQFARNVAAAGATESGFLPIYVENKLNGAEIRSLLFGAQIKGTDFEFHDPWTQRRTPDGVVNHVGAPIITGKHSGGDQGLSHIDGDALCERWPEFNDVGDICVTIFRVPDHNSVVTRRVDYVMFTDLGPMPFRVVK